MSTNVRDGVIRVDQLQMRNPPTCVDCTRKGKRKGRYVVHICAHRVSGLFCGRCVDRLEAEWDAALSERGWCNENDQQEQHGGFSSPEPSDVRAEAPQTPGGESGVLAPRSESAQRVAA